ncbi:MAG: hypothetical protein L6R39_000550 [Caloplaca ligustica]|nr:MAG: hypothetical protein L6R39_000550 [Caloplaca ligustica]
MGGEQQQDQVKSSAAPRGRATSAERAKEAELKIQKPYVHVRLIDGYSRKKVKRFVQDGHTEILRDRSENLFILAGGHVADFTGRDAGEEVEISEDHHAAAIGKHLADHLVTENCSRGDDDEISCSVDDGIMELARELSEDDEARLRLTWMGEIDSTPVAMYWVESMYTAKPIYSAQQYYNSEIYGKGMEASVKRIDTIWRVWREPHSEHCPYRGSAVKHASGVTPAIDTPEGISLCAVKAATAAKLEGLDSKDAPDPPIREPELSNGAEDGPDSEDSSDGGADGMRLVRCLTSNQPRQLPTSVDELTHEGRQRRATDGDASPDLQIRPIEEGAPNLPQQESEEHKAARYHQMVMTRLGEVAWLLRELGVGPRDHIASGGAAYTPPDDYAPVLDGLIEFLIAARVLMSNYAISKGGHGAEVTDYSQ